MRITEEHLSHYREHGYVIVEDFLTEDELSGAHREIETCIPGWLAYAEDPSRSKPKGWDVKRGRPEDLHEWPIRFPFPGNYLNRITLHPDLRYFASRLTGQNDLFCEQSDLNYKCQGQHSDCEQPMHLDFVNHTLAYPPDLPEYWQTSYILYYTDVDEFLAPTAVCSKRHYPERILWPPVFSREDRPELYDNEIKAAVTAGSLLAYSVRTFHRGTAFKRDGGRVAHFISYSPAAWKWLGIVGWPFQAVKPEFRHWIERASVREREAFGFPAPGHSYWTEETLAGVGARYPGMDLVPYRRH